MTMLKERIVGGEIKVRKKSINMYKIIIMVYCSNIKQGEKKNRT